MFASQQIPEVGVAAVTEGTCAGGMFAWQETRRPMVSEDGRRAHVL